MGQIYTWSHLPIFLKRNKTNKRNMGYLQQPTHIEKAAFFAKIKELFKDAVKWPSTGPANKAGKSVTGGNATGTVTNASKTNLNANASGMASAPAGATGAKQGWGSSMSAITGIGQRLMKSMRGGAHTNLG